ncbi:MAG: DUF4439 domain-containing protein [Jatrophihabitans sp.]|nr:MAG: DUF4439 domain-containing protein [Jatrophihabitans sp.]
MPTEVVRAWQSALAAEQEAAFGYALLGPRLRGTAQLSLAVQCSDAHEALRDDTSSALAAAGSTPGGPAADYPQLYPVDTAAQAGDLAPLLEDRCAAAWRYLYAVASRPAAHPLTAVRRDAQAALSASAVRAVRWRGAAAPPAFPGM